MRWVGQLINCFWGRMYVERSWQHVPVYCGSMIDRLLQSTVTTSAKEQRSRMGITFTFTRVRRLGWWATIFLRKPFYKLCCILLCGLESCLIPWQKLRQWERSFHHRMGRYIRVLVTKRHLQEVYVYMYLMILTPSWDTKSLYDRYCSAFSLICSVRSHLCWSVS